MCGPFWGHYGRDFVFPFPVVYEGTLILTNAHVMHDSPKIIQNGKEFKESSGIRASCHVATEIKVGSTRTVNIATACLCTF